MRGEPWNSAAFANGDSLRPSEKTLQGFCLKPAANIAWRDYLFHYTRACSGPWPGETYRQYLFDLLELQGLLGERAPAGGTALGTLVRIAREGVLRASGRMVRSRTAVVCWSSLPPRELPKIRKWRRALVRWTVEPYGVAVRRDILRALGAKPAVYGGEHTYARLSDSEKYRFQLSRSTPTGSWRHEREWRVRGDLDLSTLKPGEGFLFVRTEEEKAKMCGRLNSDLPIVGLDSAGESVWRSPNRPN